MHKSVTFLDTPETRLDDPPSYFQIFGADSEQPSLVASFQLPPDHHQYPDEYQEKHPPTPPPLPPPYHPHFLSLPPPGVSSSVEVELDPSEVKVHNGPCQQSPSLLFQGSDLSDTDTISRMQKNKGGGRVSRSMSMLSTSSVSGARGPIPIPIGPPIRTTSLSPSATAHAISAAVFANQNQNQREFSSDTEFKLNLQLFQNCIRLMALIFLLIIFFIVIQEFTKYYGEWKERAFPYQYHNTENQNRNRFATTTTTEK